MNSTALIFHDKTYTREVKRHITSGELRKLIRDEQKRGKVLQRLIFINDLYEGKAYRRQQSMLES